MALVSSTALASGDGYLCSYKQECVGLEACAATTYELSFTMDGDVALVHDDSSSLRANRVNAADDGLMVLVNRKGNTTRLLTTGLEGGSSHYTLHIHDADLAITYKGTCEKVPGA